MAGNGDRISRPNSLALEPVAAEREPLRFDVQLEGAPPEVEQLVNNIKQVAEDFLYHWKTFPIVLPASQFAGPGNRLSDIIIAPPCDEYDPCGLESGGEPQPLSPKQLHSIREKGEFEVPSRHFPGETQIWRVASWLQRGRQRSRETFCHQVAFAAALIVVVARDRLLKDKPFSALAGGRSLLKGLHRLLDLIIGMPSLEARDLEKKLRDERSRYLVAELICKPENEQDIASLAAWVQAALRRGSPDMPAEPPPVPCIYSTPQHVQIDLRLHRRELLRRAAPTLQSILERESRGWFLHFRERRAAMLASQKMPVKDIEEDIREAAMREYVSRVCNAILSNEQLAALGKDIPDLLAAQLRAYVAIERSQDGVRRKLEAGIAAAEARLRASHPILSRAEAWRKEKLDEAAKRLSEELRWTPLEDAIAHMTANKLAQHRYFLRRDLAFLRERQPLLLKELKEAKTARREFTWHTRIWLPQNWLVTRHFRGRSERIPTVISSRATSIVTPRSDPSQPVFTLQRDAVSKSNTRWPGWRLANWAHRTWCWSWNMMFILIVLIPWCAPISLRSLACVKPFVPDYELSQVNGTLFPKRSSETQTLCSRLLRLWRHVSKQRTRFDTAPDTGLLGNGLSRQAHRIWIYLIIGGLGSLCLLLLWPIACVVASSLCAVLGCSVPLWMPVACALLHVSNALVYDVDAHLRESRWLVLFQVSIWRIGVLGILQPVAAILTAIIICPIAALFILIGASFWWCIDSVWQDLVFGLVIARRGRVPLRDSTFCKRATREARLYTAQSGQALAAICARAESEYLSQWTSNVEKLAVKPLQDYKQFVVACFSPFCAQLAKTGVYKQLEKECTELTASLQEKVAARKSELALALSDSVRSRVRMTAQDLRCTIQAGGTELARIWGAAASKEEWWSQRGLAPGDWHAAAANTLLEVFDTDILSAIEENSSAAALEPRAAPVQWEQRARSGPPDLLPQPFHYLSYIEHNGCARASPPALDVSAFCGRMAPPAPAPPHAALALHNRDSDNPIPLDSDLCAEILKVLEDAPDVDERREYVDSYSCPEDEASDASAGSESPAAPHGQPLCRVSPSRERAACRWTLTGRGVRLRADLASPEDVNLDIDRAHVGTSV